MDSTDYGAVDSRIPLQRMQGIPADHRSAAIVLYSSDVRLPATGFRLDTILNTVMESPL